MRGQGRNRGLGGPPSAQRKKGPPESRGAGRPVMPREKHADRRGEDEESQRRRFNGLFPEERD